MINVDVKYYQRQIHLSLYEVVIGIGLTLATTFASVPVSFDWTNFFGPFALLIWSLDLFSIIMKQRWETNQMVHYYE